LSEQFVVEKTFIINKFETSDQEIVSYFKDVKPEEFEDRLVALLKIGISAIKTVGTTQRVDYIEKEFERLKNRFDELLESTNEGLSENIETIFGDGGKLPELMEEHFGDKGKLKTVITEYFGKDGTLIKDLFDPLKDGTPMCQLKSVLMDELNRIKDGIGIKAAEERITEITTLKGGVFEDECEAILEDLVKTKFGDELERTTDEVGKLTGSKKGDFVIKVGGKSNCKIVLETKDWSDLTMSKIHDEMDKSIENREAGYGIFVSKWVDPLPKSVGCFNFYRDDRIVCALGHQDDGVIHPEMLDLAYCWARTKLLKESARSTQIDIDSINSKLEMIKDKLKSFNKLKTQCTNIENASGKIRELSDEIKQEVTECMKGIWEEINAS